MAFYYVFISVIPISSILIVFMMHSTGVIWGVQRGQISLQYFFSKLEILYKGLFG